MSTDVKPNVDVKPKEIVRKIELGEDEISKTFFIQATLREIQQCR